VSRHGYANPYEAPGERDLTAHVAFATLAAAAVRAGGRVHGPVTQGAFLSAIGIDARTAALGPRVAADRDRLVAPEAMGTLFKALAVTAPAWPTPEGLR